MQVLLLVIFLLLFSLLSGRGTLALEEGTSPGTTGNARGQTQSRLGYVTTVSRLDAVGQASGAVGNVVATQAASIVVRRGACLKG